MSDALIVIPARFHSTRLPGKALADLNGAPLIVRILERLEPLSQAAILVATDDKRIARAVREHGGEAILTSSQHICGTDRVAEVARSRAEPIVLNVQGDEPFLDIPSIERLIRAFQREPGLEMATLACPLSSLEDWRDPNVVKVVLDQTGRALYFSRAPIPWPRDEAPPPKSALRHLGVYGFRREALLHFAEAPPSSLETIEKLEQLRALSLGIGIQVIEVEGDWGSIDTLTSLERARAASSFKK